MQRRAFLKSILAGAAVTVVPDLAVQDRAELARIGLLHPGRTVIDMHVDNPATRAFLDAAECIAATMQEAVQDFTLLEQYRPVSFQWFSPADLAAGCIPVPVVNIDTTTPTVPWRSFLLPS